MLKSKTVGNLFLAVGSLLLLYTFYQLYAPALLPSSPPIYDAPLPAEFVAQPRFSTAKINQAEKMLKTVFSYNKPGPHNYLIFNQDYLEARPTGGFPGTYTLITTENGQIKELYFDDIWNFDKPLEKLNQPQLHQFSWWADFPQAAQYASQLFTKHKGIKIDGVIAIDPTGLQNILKVLGSVYIPEFNEEVTANNFIDKILSYSPYIEDRPKQAKHKLFLGYVAKALQEKLNEYETLTKRKEIAKAFLTALETKHILVYFNNKEEQQRLKQNNWAGSLDSSPKRDFLAVRDYNAGVNKVDLYLNRDLKYKVNLVNNKAYAELKITYSYKYNKYYKKYGALADIQRKQYKNILKVYVPKKTVLMETSGYDSYVKQQQEGGKKVFQGLVALNPETKKTVTLKYRLPFLVNKQYKLIVNKQPGQPLLDTKPPLVEVELSFPGKTIEGYYPNYSHLSKGRIIFKQKLDYDRYFKVNLIPLAY